MQLHGAIFAGSAATLPSGPVCRPGLIKNRKVGDCVIELGPESVAPGARIVIEAKEEANWTLAKAREEIELARKNRDARIGLFVLSRQSAGEGFEEVGRYGDDVVRRLGSRGRDDGHPI